MKDKLQKNNRKKLFYRFRAFGIAFLLTLGVLALSSIPVIVTYTATISVAATSEREVMKEKPFFPIPTKDPGEFVLDHFG